MPNECKDLTNPENQVKKTYPVVFLLYRPDLIDIRANDLVKIFSEFVLFE
jgi:hypothetical protein